MLPSGTPTFAFTDIEGSTARWERDRAAMQDAVRRHDAILRAAIAEQGGRVFKTMGDAFYCVFARPDDALDAMTAAQCRLATEDFSAVEGLRVRMALDCGVADERDDDFFGPAVNRVARLLGLGHGGQILVSSAVVGMTAATLPPQMSLRDLGVHHLKGIAEPERVFQLVAPGLESEFPPLRPGVAPEEAAIADLQELRPVSSFSGRDSELDALGAALAGDGSVAVVHGLGGMGKSSVAREYAWRNREEYAVVWWLNAETEDGIIEGLLRLGAAFIPGIGEMQERRAAAQRVIAGPLSGFARPVLLIFDNLEDDALLRAWRPRGRARLLLTSQTAAWGSGIVVISLQAWTNQTAAAYLQWESGRADLTEADAYAIAEALGALPLALAHAAASLRGMRMVTPQRYLQHVSEHVKNAPRGSEYPRSVFATLNTAITQAERDSADAAAVLRFAASFAPDAIPEELFAQPADCYPSDLQEAVSDDFRLDAALGALDRLSLLSFAGDTRTYSMHRLVQMVTRDLFAGGSTNWEEAAVTVAAAAFPKVEFATWPQCERLLVHARTALEALPAGDEPLAAAELAQRCAVYLMARGEYAAVEPLALRSLEIRRRALGPDHPDVALSLTQLGSLYSREGRYGEAESVLARALALREQAFGEDHAEITSALNNLAVVYSEQGRYAEAEPLQKRVLAIRERAFGPQDRRVAFSLSNLGILYRDLGRFSEAESLLSRALAIREKILDADHPEIASNLAYLGFVYEDLGRYPEAEQMYVRALAIQEKALGTDHPDVLETLNCLGILRRKNAQYEDAEALHARALASQERVLGPDHPRVALTLSNLAEVYDACGRATEAQSLLTRALAICERGLGQEHPQTQAVREKLAITLSGRSSDR